MKSVSHIIKGVIFLTVTMLLNISCNRYLQIIETNDKYNSENCQCSMSKFLYLFCELHYIVVKCGLGTQNLVCYNGVFVVMGFVISGFLPIQITVI